MRLRRNARRRYASWLYAQTQDFGEVARALGVCEARARVFVKEGRHLEEWDQMVERNPDLWTPAL
jgi:hypothetical protein